jgi:single-stranded-DNA-specific exonuclease
MVEGFRRCADHLEKFGGHEHAGGLSLKTENFDLFTAAFEGVARDCLGSGDLLPLLEIDAQLNFCDIGLGLMRELESLKPFGVGNPEPLFMTAGVEVCERKEITGGARFRLRQSGRVISAVAFGAGEASAAVAGATLDVAYRLCENEWNGTSTVELKLADARPAGQTSQV